MPKKRRKTKKCEYCGKPLKKSFYFNDDRICEECYDEKRYRTRGMFGSSWRW